MSEHRTFWTAVGITLLTIGLTGFISLEIAGQFTTDKKNPGWHSPLSLACICLLIVGAVALLFVFIELARLKSIKLKLSKISEEGRGLFHSLRVLGDDDEKVPGLRDESILWMARTTQWLRSFLPEYEGHFGNVAGLLIREQLQTTTDRNVVLVSLETHLERIGEITMKI